MLPIVVFTVLAILLTMGPPVFFYQMRPGYKGIPFKIIKFRTMRPLQLNKDQRNSDEKRLTRIGKLLRKTSLDELPELWNVLKGEMSLVGPRPLLMEYLPLYTPEQARRHNVIPGITGWAQVNGRNAISWEERFKLDIWYVDHRNMGLDIKILFLTIVKVLKREGVNAENCATMPIFTGSGKEGRCV